MPISAKRAIIQFEPEAKALKQQLLKILTQSAYVTSIGFVLVLMFFTLKGKRDRRKRHISGQEVYNGWPKLDKKKAKIS